MNGIEGILAIVLIFGLPFFAVWVWFLGRRGYPAGPVAGPVSTEGFDQAMVLARRLEERIEHLERILDEDVPGWRVRAQR